MDKKRNKLLIAIIAMILFAIICLTLTIIFYPMLYIRKLKNDLDNDYIKQDFKNWKQVQIDPNISIFLPESWDLQSSSDNLLITDKTGEVVAAGERKVGFSKGDTTGFLGDYYGSNVVEYQSNVMGTNRYGNLASAHISCCKLEDGNERKQIILYLPFHHEYKYRLCFFSTAYTEEVEAIAWSMHYN